MNKINFHTFGVNDADCESPIDYTIDLNKMKYKMIDDGKNQNRYFSIIGFIQNHLKKKGQEINNIAIRCMNGCHRSVHVAECVALFFAKEYECTVKHWCLNKS